MKRIKIFISSVQSEFAEERAMLCKYIRTDVLLDEDFKVIIWRANKNESDPERSRVDPECSREINCTYKKQSIYIKS